jgi:hypothetical protein
MIVGGIIQATMGVEAAGRDLEDIAPPLSATTDELEEPGEEADPYTLGRGEGRGTEHAGGRFQRPEAQDGLPADDAAAGTTNRMTTGGDR